MNILNYVLTRLPQHVGHYPAIAKEAGVSYSWLTKLALGKMNNPSLKALERVAAVIRARK
jgi:transcriptional regulator with XRE-family HTH domain